MRYFFILFLVSCANQVPTIRSTYELKEVNGFLVSNIYVNPNELEQSGDFALIKYDIVAKNLNQKGKSIDLSSSSYLLNNKTKTMSCANLSGKKVFEVNTLETFRINCIVKIEDQASFGDSKIQLQIPLEKELLTFNYFLRAEDFQ